MEEVERKYELYERYGKPAPLAPAEGSPPDVFVYRYRDKEAYDAFVASNAEHNPEVTQLGFRTMPDGTVIGAIRVSFR